MQHRTRIKDWVFCLFQFPRQRKSMIVFLSAKEMRRERERSEERNSPTCVLLVYILLNIKRRKKTEINKQKHISICRIGAPGWTTDQPIGLTTEWIIQREKTFLGKSKQTFTEVVGKCECWERRKTSAADIESPSRRKQKMEMSEILLPQNWKVYRLIAIWKCHSYTQLEVTLHNGRCYLRPK